MGVRFPSVSSNTIIGSPAAAAETIIATSPALTIPLDFAQVLLFWFILLTIGTAGNAVTLRLRRGTGVTGAVVNIGGGATTAVATNVVALSGSYADTPGAVAAQQYTLTAQIAAATAVSTVTDVSLIAFSL